MRQRVVTFLFFLSVCFLVLQVEHLNGFRTIDENLADNGGLQMAFQAYKKYVSKHGREERLLGLSAYSPEQLFFIGYTTVRQTNFPGSFPRIKVGFSFRIGVKTSLRKL